MLLAGTYALEAQVAHGAVDLTWNVRDSALDAPLSARLTPDDAAHAEALLAQYRREVWLARHIEHPALPRAFTVGSDAGVHFITMERLEGTALPDALKARRRFTASEVARLGGELADALAHLHDHRVVHGALMPSTVLIDGDGRARLRSIGTAYTLDEAARGVQHALGAGRYLAPEQIAGAGGDARVDLYALGLVLFELLTGRPPFDDASDVAASVRRLREDAPDPTRFAPVPAALAMTVRRCLARDPAGRFADARALADALRSKTAPTALAPRDAGAPAQVVVAPFEAHGSPEAEVLAAAVPEELAEALRHAGSLRARTGSLAHTRLAGRGALLVVDGRVSSAPERARVRLRLRDGATGAVRWSEDFEVPLDPSRGPEGALAWRLSEPLRVAAQSVAEGGDLPQPVLEKFFLARRLVREGGLTDPDDAVTLLDQVLAVAPSFAGAHTARAMACVRGWSVLRAAAGQRDWYDEAQTSLARSVALAPDAAETHFAKAHLASQLGRYRDAVAAIREALSRAPMMPEAHQVLGSLQLEAGRSQLGLERLDLALALDAHLPRALFEQARWRVLYGDPDAAESTIARLARMPATEHLVGHLRARAGVWRRDPELVRRGLREFERANLATAPLMLTYARAALGAAEAEAAVATFNDAMGAHASPKQRAQLRQLCVEVLCARGEWERALEHLREGAAATLVDLEWVDWCPLLDELRTRDDFARCRAQVAARSAEIWNL